MKKFYQKKDLPVEESPLTLQLQRRHTVVEGDKDSAKVVTGLKPVSRSNSTSSIYRSPKTAKDLSSQKGYLESTLSSGSSSASTVVITECQLSSSWLYNNKKAQMRQNEASVESASSPQQASNNEAAKSPLNLRPKVKSISSENNRSRRCSSCCCYGAIIMLAGFAIMGIISTIGGIIYMEFFSGSNKTYTRGQSVIDLGEDASYMKKFGQVLDVNENHTAQDRLGVEIRNPSSKSRQKLDILDHTDSNNDNTNNKKNKESGNILRVKKMKKDIIPTTDADIHTSINMSYEQNPQEDSIKDQSLHQKDFLTSSSKNNSPYSKLFELYKDTHTNNNKNSSLTNESLKFEIKKLNAKITDLRTYTSDSLNISIPALAHKNGLESTKQSRILEESFDTNDSLDSLQADSFNSEDQLTQNEKVLQTEIPKYFFQRPQPEPSSNFRDLFGIANENNVDSEEQPSVHKYLPSQISDTDDNVRSKLDMNNQDVSLDSDDSLNESFELPLGEVSGPAIPKNFFQMPAKETVLNFRNIFEMNENNNNDDVLSEKSFHRFLPHVPELSDQNDTGDNVSNTQESDLPLELNHPVMEAKITVPGPLDLVRRFTTGKDSDDGRDTEMEQHDRRFFLAGALERLRSLDVGNILPSSRQKSDYKKSPKDKFVPKVQSEQEVVTERSNYLQKLRRLLYEQ